MVLFRPILIHKENPESAPVSILRVGSGHANKKLKDLPLQESVVKLQQFIKDSRRRWLYHCPRQYSASVSLLPDVQLQSKAIIPRPTLSAHREQQIMIFCNQKNKQTLRGDWRQTGEGGRGSSGNRISSVLAESSGANTGHYLYLSRHHTTQCVAGLLVIQQTIHDSLWRRVILSFPLPVSCTVLILGSMQVIPGQTERQRQSHVQYSSSKPRSALMWLLHNTVCLSEDVILQKMSIHLLFFSSDYSEKTLSKGRLFWGLFLLFTKKIFHQCWGSNENAVTLQDLQIKVGQYNVFKICWVTKNKSAFKTEVLDEDILVIKWSVIFLQMLEIYTAYT